MDAGDGVKRIGRADQPQQLAGRAGSLRELLLSRRSFTTFSCRCGWAKPQPQRRNEWTRTSKYAWRARLSMHISNGWSRQPEVRPVALPNPRRSHAEKTGAPTCEKGVRCAPPSKGGGQVLRVVVHTWLHRFPCRAPRRARRGFWAAARSVMIVRY